MFRTNTFLPSNKSIRMVQLSRDDVPLYLRHGRFFNSLDADDNEKFEVSDNCCKLNTTVESGKDLLLMFESLRFWGVNHLPIEAASLLYSDRYLCRQLMKKFPEFKDVLQRIEREPPGNITISKAIRFGCGVDAVRSLQQRGNRLCAEHCVDATTVDDLESLMYLRERRCPWNSNVISAAVKCGSVSCLQYLLNNGCPCDFDMMEQAVLSGQVESVKCLLRNGEHITPALAASTWNHVDVLWLMSKQGLHTPGLTCRLCAEQNRVDALKYLHHQGCFWDEATCAAAGREGSLTCLTYAHTHGCPWDDRTTTNAGRHGHVECLQYAVQNGCPLSVEPCAIMVENHYNCAIYLAKRNYKVDEFCLGLGFIAILQLLALNLLVLGAMATFCFAVYCIVMAGSALCVVLPLLAMAYVITCGSEYIDNLFTAALNVCAGAAGALVTSVLNTLYNTIHALCDQLLELVDPVGMQVLFCLNFGMWAYRRCLLLAAPLLLPILLVSLRLAKFICDYAKE